MTFLGLYTALDKIVPVPIPTSSLRHSTKHNIHSILNLISTPSSKHHLFLSVDGVYEIQ